MSIDTFTGALLAGLSTVTGALGWMTIGRFQDREKYSEKIAELYKELAEAHAKQLEKVFLLTHEQSIASTAWTAALNGLREQLSDVHEVLNENTTSMNGFMRDALRDVRQGRRTVSDSTMRAVVDTLDRALEKASAERSDPRVERVLDRRGGR